MAERSLFPVITSSAKMNTQQKSRTMESSKLKTSTLAAAWLIKPVVVMGTFISLRAFVDPLYSNPQCAARLVNETDPVRGDHLRSFIISCATQPLRILPLL